MSLSSSRFQCFFVVAVICAITCLAGCQKNDGVFGVTSRSFNWSDKLTESDRIPGVDEGAISFVKLQSGPTEGLSFVIWSDLSSNTKVDGNSATDGASYEGYQAGKDGMRINFSAKTTDGVTGSLNIGEIEYQLTDGAVFLISTTQEPPVIERIKLDLSKFPKTQEEITEYAKTNQEIEKFFASLNVKKATDQK